MSRPGTGDARVWLLAALLAIAVARPALAETAHAVPRLELAGPDAGLFVGQLETVEIRLLVPDGDDLSEVSPPVLSGAGLTISPLADAHPRESRALVDDVPTTVLTWTAAVSAVKPGAQTLEASLDGVQTAREPSARRSGRPTLPGGGFFGDDFFGGSLFARVLGELRQQPVHLASRPLQLEIEALPETGRPADFGGAVGQFHFEAKASPTRSTAGDPVTLTLSVEGRGNFDRVRVAGFSDVAGFKAYSPTERFEGDDATGVAGRKLFEQTIIPERASSREIPPQRFSFFDPERREYLTLTSAAVSLEVASAGPEPGRSATAPPPDAVDSQNTTRETAPGVLALRSDLGALRRDTTPLLLRPAILAVCAAPLLTLCSVGFVAWRRRLRIDPARVRALAARRVVSESLRTMEAAVEHEDSAVFHDALRRALQARLALHTGANPAALTAADVERLLGGDLQLAREMRRLFEDAEAAAYAGRTVSASALRTRRGHAIETLTRLEALA